MLSYAIVEIVILQLKSVIIFKRSCYGVKTLPLILKQKLFRYTKLFFTDHYEASIIIHSKCAQFSRFEIFVKSSIRTHQLLKFDLLNLKVIQKKMFHSVAQLRL